MALSEIEQVRLNTGQDDDFNFLSDAEIQHLLDTYGSVRVATLQAARIILFKLSRQTHEKVELLEIWGNQAFDNYLRSLKMLLNDSQFSDSSTATPYAGGISKSDIAANLADVDNFVVDIEGSDQSRADTPFDLLDSPFSSEY